MTRASQLLTAEERTGVEVAIAEAERGTAGEIVVVVATRSDGYERGEDLCGIVLGLLAIVGGWVLGQGVAPVSEAWGSGVAPTLGLLGVLALFLVGFWVGQALAWRFPLLARMFVPGRLMEAALRDRAAQAFHRFRIRRTVGATGVVIYLSVFERMVTVLADDEVAQKVDPAAWADVRDLVLQGIREDRPGEGLAAAVRRAGEVLAEFLPADEDNPNELTNSLRLLD